MGIVEEECDESMYWMGLIVEAGLMEEKLLMDLKNEANEILFMISDFGFRIGDFLIADCGLRIYDC